METVKKIGGGTDHPKGQRVRHNLGCSIACECSEHLKPVTVFVELCHCHDAAFLEKQKVMGIQIKKRELFLVFLVYARTYRTVVTAVIFYKLAADL